MTCSRRQTLHGLLGGFGLAGVSGIACAPSSRTGRPSTTDTADPGATVFDEQALRGPLERLLEDSPWADVDFASRLRRLIEELTEAGLTDTAEMVTQFSNVVYVGGARIAEGDMEDPIPLLHSIAQTVDGFVDIQDALARLASTAAIELTAANGDEDTIEASELQEAKAALEEHETKLRSWLYELGEDGEAGQNATLVFLARSRQRATEDLSIDDACDAFATAAADFGDLSGDWKDMIPDFEESEAPPPPVDWDAVCTTFTLLGVAFGGIGGAGGSLSGGSQLDDGISAIEEVIRDQGLAVAAEMFDICSAIGSVVKIMLAGISLCLACVGVGLAMAALAPGIGGLSFLQILFLVSGLIIALAGVACSVKAIIDMGFDAQECP